MSGSENLNAPENNSFATYFMHLRLRRECKEDYKEVGKIKTGTEL